MAAFIKTEEEIGKIRIAGGILSHVLRELTLIAESGVTLRELDEVAHELIVKHGGEPAFLGYRPEGASRPYPATLCASLNDTVVHGVPTKRRLVSGDLLKLDLGVRYRGYYSDSAVTIPIGEVDAEAKKLIATTLSALKAGITAARPGMRLGDIGHAIAHEVRRGGFSVVRGLTGHGVGKALHEDPSVFNEGQRGKGLLLKRGMVLAIEPMVAMGKPGVVQGSDESYATEDGSLAAHFEHTVVITGGDPEILTA
jgi:methionyl aminopeptidase